MNMVGLGSCPPRMLPSFPRRRATRSISIFLVTLLAGVPITSPVYAQGMCADCDALAEKPGIVETRIDDADDSIAALEAARREFDRNVSVADAFATAYAALQGVNVALGFATLPCGIPHQWLRGLFAGTGALSELAPDGAANDVTLATILGYAGFGVASDISSLDEFVSRWRRDGKSLDSLREAFDGPLRNFKAAKRNLESEHSTIQADMRRANCANFTDWLFEDL